MPSAKHTIWVNGQPVEIEEPEDTVLVDGHHVEIDDSDAPEVKRRDNSSGRKRELRRAFAGALHAEPPVPVDEPDIRESRRIEVALRHASERKRNQP